MPALDVHALAARHHVSVDAVVEVVGALRSSGGSLAQFSHPDLGGRGQWMPGMVQIGDMFNDALKAKVAALCTDVAALVMSTSSARSSIESPPKPESSTVEPMQPMRPMARMSPMPPMKPMSPMKPLDSWWPARYGTPAAAGSQDDVRYAWFAEKRRLLVDVAGYVAVYDTAEHTITGIAQAQGDRAHLRFSSEHGPIALDALHAVEV